MTEPRIELRPLKAALNTAGDTDLTVLIRLHAPAAERSTRPRPPLNLALVLDRSGSMAGHPLHMAREAAQAAVRQLRAGDRVSIVAFDDAVEVALPSQTVTDEASVLAAIARIQAGGSTALHAGWFAGASEVASHLDPAALNRVILLTDGRANVGLQRLGDIAPQVRGLSQRGVSTSAIGLGAHYDEDLLLGLANAGDGNFEHVEDPARLPTFFESELQGLSRSSGRTVSLGLEPNAEFGVRVAGVLGDLERNAYGRWQLPNLQEGQPIDVIANLHVPTQGGRGGTIGVMRARLAWTDARGRHKRREQLDLPLLDPEAYQALPDDREVQTLVAVLEAARLRRESMAALDRGDRAKAGGALSDAIQRVQAAPASAAIQAELTELDALSADLAAGDDLRLRKRALSQAYDRSRSKPRR